MIFNKEEMAAQLKRESTDYAASRPKEFNQGFLHSGVNQLVRGSQNIKRFGTLKDTLKIGE